jgi:transcriptional regulator with XRE-family HTH domain
VPVKEEGLTTHLWAVIEEWRDAQLFSVSQAALASKLGVSRSAMSQWKKGEARPNPEHLRKLAEVTRIPYARLLEAVNRDMGYLDSEGVGRDGNAAAKKRARESLAHEPGAHADLPGVGSIDLATDPTSPAVPPVCDQGAGSHPDTRSDR